MQKKYLISIILIILSNYVWGFGQFYLGYIPEESNKGEIYGLANNKSKIPNIYCLGAQILKENNQFSYGLGIEFQSVRKPELTYDTHAYTYTYSYTYTPLYLIANYRLANFHTSYDTEVFFKGGYNFVTINSNCYTKMEISNSIYTGAGVSQKVYDSFYLEFSLESNSARAKIYPYKENQDSYPNQHKDVFSIMSQVSNNWKLSLSYRFYNNQNE